MSPVAIIILTDVYQPYTSYGHIEHSAGICRGEGDDPEQCPQGFRHLVNTHPFLIRTGPWRLARTIPESVTFSIGQAFHCFSACSCDSEEALLNFLAIFGMAFGAGVHDRSL